jgi:hypothetical protein
MNGVLRDARLRDAPRLEGKYMEDEEHFERAILAERFADPDGDHLAAVLSAGWGDDGTAQAIAALERTARRLSFLVGCCRLAATRRRRML